MDAFGYNTKQLKRNYKPIYKVKYVNKGWCTGLGLLDKYFEFWTDKQLDVLPEMYLGQVMFVHAAISFGHLS